MRKQILAVGLCLSLALTPAASMASPNASEPLTEETALTSAPTVEETALTSAPTVEETAPTSAPMVEQADPQSPLTEEMSNEAAEPTMPAASDGVDAEEVENNKNGVTGEQSPAGPDDVLAPQASDALILYDGVYSSWDLLDRTDDYVAYTFTLYHRSRVSILYETETSAALGTCYIQMYDNRGGGSWAVDKIQFDNGDTKINYPISYNDLTNPPRSIGPGVYTIVVWYENNYYSGSYGWCRAKLNIKPLYSDLPKSHWAANVVADMVDKGFMFGFDDTSFGTNYNISRGQMASILWNLQGRPQMRSTYSFWDVPTDKYYSMAVAWAKAAGVVSGYPDGSFKPGQNVARQELAVMLHNYAVRFKGASNTGASPGPYSNMIDGYKVAPYARNAVGWCFYRGIMSGSNRLIRPNAPASRAEAAKMCLVTSWALGL